MVKYKNAVNVAPGKVVLSFDNGGLRNVVEWGVKVANSWRTTPEIKTVKNTIYKSHRGIIS